MAGLIDPPKMQTTPVVDPSDVQNRMNQALEQRISAGGTNSTLLSSYMSGASSPAQARQPTLTGTN